jgi:hypothetical protein
MSNVNCFACALPIREIFFVAPSTVWTARFLCRDLCPARDTVNCLRTARLFCRIRSGPIASGRSVAYPLDSSHHACHASGGNTLAVTRRVNNIVGPAISASSSEPDAVDVNDFASVSLNVFPNALAIILRHRNREEDDEDEYQRPKDDIHRALFRSRCQDYFFSR